MPSEPRFLIGFGERLTEPVPPPGGGGKAPPPYEVGQARERLQPQFRSASELANALPDIACPEDRVVSVLTLHPSYVAKSYFPESLLQAAGFESVGSRPAHLVPDLNTHSFKGPDGKRVFEARPGNEERPTTELFVESSRGVLNEWTRHLGDFSTEFSAGEEDIVLVERFRLSPATERLRLPAELPDEVPLEVVLHAAGRSNYGFVIEAFEEYARQLGVDADLDRRLVVGSLCFVPALAPQDQIEPLADFSFLRVARPMPRLRFMEPVDTVIRALDGIHVTLPLEGPADSELRIAVFDGGVAPGSPLASWVTNRDAPGVGNPVDAYLEHGEMVTSALAFGSIEDGAKLQPPYGQIDHYRVLDEHSEDEPYELYDVIRRIESVLTQHEYDFVNLSIGPSLPIEDDEVHSWTAFLDEHLADGRTLATVAIGNNGCLDRMSGNARIQVPGDAVNALAVGAASSQRQEWARAPYSAFGPGRTPGLIKPDLLMFGGVVSEPFLAFGSNGQIVATRGTSFAAPSALRTAVGVRCVFGERLDPLALRALLIHAAVPAEEHDPSEHGWGRVEATLEPIIVCPDGTARVVYQGTLTPAKYLRARIPVPQEPLVGIVQISATLVFASEVEPEQPSNYTRSGIEVVFRPDATNFKSDASTRAKTSSFFSKKPYASEAELRADAHKWETVLHESVRKRGTSLNNPAFEIHYNARAAGGDGTSKAPRLRYAMVITVESKNTPDLYDRVLRTYATQLEALVPRVGLNVRIPT